MYLFLLSIVKLRISHLKYTEPIFTIRTKFIIIFQLVDILLYIFFRYILFPLAQCKTPVWNFTPIALAISLLSISEIIIERLMKTLTFYIS